MEQRLSLREVQLAELNILDNAAHFLDAHGIRYVLAYGTLIGAIRHNGFIPWDDDIDIFIPRDDYEKLKQIVKNGEQISDDIKFLLPGDKGYKYPFIKAVDLSYNLYDTNNYVNGYEEHLWVDIFPLNNVSDNHNRFLKDHKVLRLLAKITQYDVTKIDVIHVCSTILQIMAKTLAFFMGGYSKAAVYADRISYRMHQKYKNSKHLGDGAWGGNKNYFPVQHLDRIVKHAFEDKEFCIPEEYDAMLRITYGDYMQIPPVEKRQSHFIEVYRHD